MRVVAPNTRVFAKDAIERYKVLPVQLKASFWYLVCLFLQRAISTLTTPIFTRLLSTSEYGQLSVFNSWYGIAIVIVPLCLSAGMHMQGVVKFGEERDVFTSSLQGLVLLLVLCWGGIYLIAMPFWNNLLGLSTVQVLSMLVMVWTFSVIGFWGNEQRTDYHYKSLVVVALLVSILKPLVGIVLVMICEDKVTARIVGMAAVELAAYGWMFFSQVRKGGRLYSARFWKYGLLFNLPLIPHYLSSTVLSSSDRIMIRELVGYGEAGIYSLSYSVALVMTMFSSAVSQTISPWIFQRIKERRTADIAPVAYAALSAIAVVNLILMLFAPEVVAVFAPKSYSEAVVAIPPVSMSVFFMFCYELFSKFAFYYERTSFVSVASVGAAVLNIVLNYALIPVFGYVAAGYTTLGCYIAYACCHYVYMGIVCTRYGEGFPPLDARRILSIGVPFLLCGFVILATYGYPLVRYGLVALACMLCFAYRKQIVSAVRGMLQLRRA